MTRSFPLAPMDRLIGALTLIVLALPVLFVAISLGAPPSAWVLGPTAIAMVALYVAVWLGARPTRFVVGPDGIDVVFPTWTRRIPRAALRDVELFPADRFRSEVGWGLRVGVGGLWGGFGLLITPKGTLEMYISRVGDLVIVRCAGRRDLLLSPDDIDAFGQALRDVLRRPLPVESAR